MADIAQIAASVPSLRQALETHRYICSEQIATAVYLAYHLRKPVLIEGPPGVGKTELAKTTAAMFDLPLIRLQCYEGLDVHHAVYEWNYTRQMMHIRLLEARGERANEAELFGPEFLLRRPLLQAIEQSKEKPPVLLIDELDRSDEEFEAFLLEVLSDFQITIPEIGTIKTDNPPVVVITSNRTREVHDALIRRCLYYWIDYPAFEKELEIVRARLPHAPDKLARQVTGFIQALREMDLYKLPGVAETLDWTTALVALDQNALDPVIVDETLGAVLKYQDDVEKVKGAQARLILDRVKAGVD